MSRRRATAIAGLVLLVAGCGAGADGPDDPATGSADPSPTASSSTPTSSESPEAAEPTVEPATGVELEVLGFRVNAPKKWSINNSVVIAESATGPVDDGRSGAVLLGLIGSDEQVSLKQALRTSWHNRGKPAGSRGKPDGFERQPDTVLGGLSAFYYTAKGNKFLDQHVMGNWDSGSIVELRITLPNAMSPARQKEIVDSIVATYRSPRDG